MLDTFDGSRGKDPEEWLEQYERVATFNRWEDDMDSSAKTW